MYGREAVPVAAAFHHKSYSLDALRVSSAKDFSVLGFAGVEAIDEARRFNITFTYPLADLPRGDYVSRPATFTLQPVSFSTAPAAKGRKIQGVVHPRREPTRSTAVLSRMRVMRVRVRSAAAKAALFARHASAGHRP
ncbi:hypothetical protein SAMN05446927_7223 [Caballeronia arationis]|jgi:uncharacterized protein involved in type VI secretion and phage assembly|uniref:Uncharacterized protein n=1 Tax=Caballeronia arationis TaxID=1777142 RepID=A0A7Z7ID90_9BURK|nr:hypothetical protein SAMN05446927_7223 [Caballeronia arationis]